MSAEQIKPLWRPSQEQLEDSRLTGFLRWIEAERGLRFEDYGALWRWSVDDLDGFWRAVWDFFDVQADGNPDPVLGVREMPGAEWFPETTLNYAEHALRNGRGEQPAILHTSELRGDGALSWDDLSEQVAAVAAGLRSMGVEAGDCVASYCPNIPETIVTFLACASIGAVWSSCSPDFGLVSVTDRFAQVEPRVLFAVDGYSYGGRDFGRLDTVADLQATIASIERVVLVPYLDPSPDLTGLDAVVTWDSLLADHAGAPLCFERVPFSHPLWTLYSSGTTGVPKAIVQSQGGILLEHLKVMNLQTDAQPGDRLFWFTTTGWMMWNFLVSGLLSGTTVVLYDGNPGYPDLNVLWDWAARAGVTIFGTSAAYISACMKAGIEPRSGRDLGSLRALGSTGSALPPEGFDWIYEQLGPDLWLFSTSGGTDICSGFIGGVPILPVYRGELQGPALGVALAAWDEEGEPVMGRVGELVVTEPMPSMPLFFWGDEDGSRYRESYFEMFPGVWRHGDWLELTERGTGIIYGRSDSTINRGGIRIGTAEIYRGVLSVDGVIDALVVDVPKAGTEGWIMLFVVLAERTDLDNDLIAQIARRVRTTSSPRHVPDQVLEIDEVPRTLSNKVLEVPVKRILMGMPWETVVSRDSLANPTALDYFIEMARGFRRGEDS